MQDATLSIPIGATGLGEVKVGMTATMTTCAADPRVIGRRFTVVAAPVKSQATARRFRVQEVVA